MSMRRLNLNSKRGWNRVTLAVLILAAGIYIYDNAGDFVTGFKQGYENVRK